MGRGAPSGGDQVYGSARALELITYWTCLTEGICLVTIILSKGYEMIIVFGGIVGFNDFEVFCGLFARAPTWISTLACAKKV